MPMLPVPEVVFRTTDLAKRTFLVVTQALRAPVTVKSPHGHVSVLAYDRFRNTEKRAHLVEAMMRARVAADGDEPMEAFPPDLRWMRALTRDELAAFSDEVLATLNGIALGASLERVDAVLGRWAARSAANVERAPEPASPRATSNVVPFRGRSTSPARRARAGNVNRPG